jgi:histidine ammonia-lyase
VGIPVSACSTLEALAALLNKDVIPVVPGKGSVGASGDLAPLSHLAIVLLGGARPSSTACACRGRSARARIGLSR